ncbi:uncharacterized protein OCT59_002105 [Rhizophagus irregularis]|uniref:uncharacterized protein n=1 Tax=Rhizophagus irregularis TaxID=588596 RepID=UPI0033322B11|nr:hypothetical protein OCT59_002105 [Rhizophagus irregularis]
MDNRLGTITPYNNLRILSKGYQQEIRQQEIITNVKKTHVSKLETMKSLLWKLPISDLQAFREKLEHENSVDELCIEVMHHLINCLDAYWMINPIILKDILQVNKDF